MPTQMYVPLVSRVASDLHIDLALGILKLKVDD
jgi:hypothetical protein